MPLVPLVPQHLPLPLPRHQVTRHRRQPTRHRPLPPAPPAKPPAKDGGAKPMNVGTPPTTPRPVDENTIATWSVERIADNWDTVKHVMLS